MTSADRTPANGKPGKQSTGTAFAVSAKGDALTNHHIVDGCTEVKVTGREGLAKAITSDSVNDIALLQLPGGDSEAFSTFNTDPAKLRQGEDIVVFGYPLDSLLSSGGNLTPGALSALTGLGNQIQITAPLQPTRSGSRSNGPRSLASQSYLPTASCNTAPPQVLAGANTRL